MNSVFIKVPVSQRIPDTHFESYSTDKGLLFEIEMESKGANWWLEEIELPTEEEIYIESGKNSKRTYQAFCKGANFILDKLKGGNNG